MLDQCSVMLMSRTTEVRYENPPVRVVRLTYFYSSEPAVSVTDVIGVLARWRSEFPDIDESAPRPPIKNTYEFIPLGDANWPLPFITLADIDGLITLFVQSDRFGVQWMFMGDGARYPGFDQLRRSLDQRFDEFRSELRSADRSVVVHGVECHYQNELRDIPTNDFVAGLLSKWTINKATLDIDSTESTSYRRHFHPNVDGDCAAWISLDSDGESSDMVFTVRTLEIADDNRVATLEAAHDFATDMLVRHTSEEMRTSWAPS